MACTPMPRTTTSIGCWRHVPRQAAGNEFVADHRPQAVHPLLVNPGLVWVELPMMLAFAALLYPMMQADLRILVGSIIPHGAAGFSGGSKLVPPVPPVPMPSAMLRA